MSGQYILVDREPVAEPDLLTWARWMERDRDARHVAETTIGPSRVSTLFLGFDHALSGPRRILFETMIFGGPEDGYQARYSTWAEAEAGHAKAVDRILQRPTRLYGED